MSNMQRRTAAGVALAAALGATGYGLYALGLNRGMDRAAQAGSAAMTAPSTAPGPSPSPVPVPVPSIAAGEAATRAHLKAGLKAGDTDPTTGRRILYYQDPMVPGKRFDTPGKSPFMDMMLVPVLAEAPTTAQPTAQPTPNAAAAPAGGVSVDPRIQQSLGVRTALVTEGVLQAPWSAVGSIAYNERDQSVLQARAAGYVEKLHVRATLDRVTRGQPFAELYVPDWVAAQEEFLGVKRAAPGDSVLVAAARQRMKLVGMSDAQVARVDAANTVQPRLTLTAPSSGVVAELLAREGMSVAPGALLARINGLGTVWALADVPESQAAQVRPGTPVEARTPGVPGAVFRGVVQALLPEVNTATRTLKARIELVNPGPQLLPGMFVTLQFKGALGADKAVLIPSEALIQTGRRSVVLLADDGGRFTPVDVVAGAEAGGQTEVKQGLKAGQRVVVSAQFLIDSEASLKGVEARLNDASAASGVQR